MTDESLLVVPCMSNNVLAVLDLDAHEVVAHLPLPRRGPSGVFASPDGRRLYCLASGGCDVVVMDVATWTVEQVIPVEGSIIDRGKLPASGPDFWVSVIMQGHVHCVDTVAGEVTRSFPKVGPCFVISEDEQLLSTLSADKRGKPGTFTTRSAATGEVLGETAVPAMSGFPLGMWTAGTRVYWTELAKAGALHVVDVSDPAAPTYVSRVALGSAPLAAEVMPNGTIWVPNAADATVSVVDAASLEVVHTLEVGHYVGHVQWLDGRAYLNQLKRPGPMSFWRAMWVTIPAPYLGVYVTPLSGHARTRPVLDQPAEVVAYDGTTYERLPLPPLTLPSLAFTSAVVRGARPGPSEPSGVLVRTTPIRPGGDL